MSLISFSSDFLIDVRKGNVAGHSIVSKFGRNAAVGTTLVPIALSGIYQTPTALTSLEILSDNAADGVAGAGARKVTIQGIGTGYSEVTEEITMNGTGAVAVSAQFYRIYRLWVSEAGSYADATTPSHIGTITLRVASAGATWATMGLAVTGFGMGQSQIGCYTIPTGKTGYLLNKFITIESTKVASVFFFQRQAIDDVSTPYLGAMRLVEMEDGVSGAISYNPPAPISVFPEKTDVGFMGVLTSSTAKISVDFELLLVDD